MPLTSRTEQLGRALACLLLVVALAPIARPFVNEDFARGHDATAHLTNVYRFDRAFTQGQIPVRWVEGMGFGRGQPLFNYYQVGFYYGVELLHQLGLSLSVAYKAAPVILWWLGALFTYLFLRPYGIAAAAAGTFTFALSPYLIVDVFVRAAYPEFAAIVFAVGLLWASDAFLRTGRRRSLACAAIFCALMLVCHLPATLIATPMIAAHMAYGATRTSEARARLTWLVAADALGLGLASFYVIPALAELPLIRIHRLTTGSSDFHQHFVPLMQSGRYLWNYTWNYGGSSFTNPADLMPAHVSLVQWLSIVAAAVVIGMRLRRRDDRRPGVSALVAWLGVALLALFMMSRVSVGVWDALPPLAFIQFPWRFFLLVSIAGSVLVAVLVSMLESRTARIVALLLVAGVHVHLYERRLRPVGYIPHAEMAIDHSHWGETDVARRVGFSEAAYDPVGAVDGTLAGARWTIVRGSARAVSLREEDARLVLAIDARDPSVVRVNTPVFDGWQLRVDGAAAPLVRDSSTGYIAVILPTGHHIVDARFVGTGARRVANLTSLASLLLLPLVVFGYRARAPHAAREPAASSRRSRAPVHARGGRQAAAAGRADS